MMSYDEFLEALGNRESGKAGYSAVNQFGYLGKYQMGEALLTDLGFYTPDGTKTNDWQNDHWTGKDGVYNKQAFLDKPAAQESAVREEMSLSWGRLKSVWHYVDHTVNGIKITISGLLAGAHLVGVSAEIKYLTSGSDQAPKDGNSVAVTSYMKQFAGYETPFSAKHHGTDALTGRGNDHVWGFGGHEVMKV